MRTPIAYEKLTLGIDAATASGQLTCPLMTYNEAIKLPYLDACCKEAMRLHPSVALTLPRNVPAGGCEIAGEYFPAGRRVGFNAAVVHRNRDIFGQDADDFVPEPWLRADTTIMDRHMFQFGGGSRNCVGKNVRNFPFVLHRSPWPHPQPPPLTLWHKISLCEMYKLVPQILHIYHILLVDDAHDWTTHNYWFHKASSVNTKVEVRD